MLHRSNTQSLVHRGRKAGLNAREMNVALSSQPGFAEDGQPGQPDCNGSVYDLNPNGQRVYRPANLVSRS